MGISKQLPIIRLDHDGADDMDRTAAALAAYLNAKDCRTYSFNDTQRRMVARLVQRLLTPLDLKVVDSSGAKVVDE